MTDITIATVKDIDIAFEPWAWPFALERRGEIDSHFAERCRERPGIWNGRVLLSHRHAVVDGRFRAACFEADYASFLAWRDWKFPDRSVSNFFAAGALSASDGAYILGEMAPHTAVAGSIYFPAGTPEPDDIVAGRVDLAGNIARELQEETGLEIAEFEAEPGWIEVVDRGYRVFIKPLTARVPADELRSRILRHLANEPRPEFCKIHIVRGPIDLQPQMPDYVTAFLTDAWRRRS
jgi:8-oxo-dGTP pyrophosphatase MutT (NUDIX family)